MDEDNVVHFLSHPKTYCLAKVINQACNYVWEGRKHCKEIDLIRMWEISLF